ncbi:hypothetical protein CIPAW_04G084100 [Carya illinoinensis]|uniref:Uncharacterized protein n=1 Tax=Carya illinoinensis TaxID=32201 RepID=A0A8T1QT57_CARIL|nr:hypothetical protein CIPAW_04G084100 [Carya illinoinensis]
MLFPIHLGIFPDNPFSPPSKITMLVQFLKDDGSSPSRLLLLKCKDCNDVACPNELGMTPERLLAEKSRTTKILKLLQQSGMSPDSLFLERSRTRRVFILHNDSGIEPLI